MRRDNTEQLLNDSDLKALSLCRGEGRARSIFCLQFKYASYV